MSDNPLDPRDFERQPPPADAATPFLDLDADRLDRNLRHMQQRADDAGVKLRPHIKTHKSVRLAQRQIDLGAVGVTASKPSEAIVFVEGGIASVTLAYPVIRAGAIDALLEVAGARDADVRFILDSAAGLDALIEAGRRHGRCLPVFVKVDVGLGRVGVAPASELGVTFARALHDAAETSFAGLISHAGQAYGAPAASAMAAIALKEAADLLGLRARIEAAGVAVPCLSVGATPTCLAAPIASGIDEIRPGNYAFLDRTALRLGLCGPDDLAISLVSTVIARNRHFAIVDAGSKALSSDTGPHGTAMTGFGLVALADRSPEQLWVVERMSEEHGFVPCADGELPLGARIRIFPNHACSTVACFDGYGPRSVSAQWPVDGRGCFV